MSGMRRRASPGAAACSVLHWEARSGTDGSFDFSGTGPWVFPRRPGTNEPGIWETVGNLSFTVDPEGNESVHLAGRLVGLCTELAAW